MPAESLPKLSMYIDGQWVAPASGEYLETVDPYTAKPWALVPRGNAQDADRAIQAAHRAFREGPWGRMHPSARGRIISKFGDLIEANADALAEIEVRDNGRLLAEMRHQIRYIPRWYHYYAGLADKIEGAVHPCDKEALSFSRHEPLGVCVGIVPWNAPLFLFSLKAAPALAAGCTLVMKPAEHTSATALKLMELVEEAGFPPGVINVVTGYGPEVGEPLVTHPLTRHVGFTGSTKTGAHLYSLAARDIKRVSLELGGKSPNIVFDDADLDNAVRGVVGGIFGAVGQTCIAGSRLLVHRKVHDQFLEKLAAFTRTARIGDPRHMDTRIGPIANAMQYQKVLGYIDIARDEGAELVLGGKRPDIEECASGFFIEPTIFAGVNNDMRIAREEVFGPVLAAIPFDEPEEAVAIANDSEFGLAAGVWTADMRRALLMSQRIEAGSVWVNTYRDVSYTTPFGGYKKSGIGRENGIEGIREFLQTKAVWLSTAEEIANPFVIG
ncbi:aldehyde dehydrogenase [Paracoccus denitrificans]|jgi:aldehyde dehydrogenase (NAD+)/betaine-aldehyde dehydrogenase|nr:aldehyde dehydrogenase [Paracoccus denitrificans]MBB4628378.1 aldehyde dehydrogenase (NAD+)/betaine-aldehyde dehydrogenase [Paracoccus denitrificans]MCU7429590.1 aldehyde dehydrogenase [Paracoccus denitrificans]QAR29396.1 aldehyde dehydrogenase [Paracoccus denitrificans]UPV98276.1 aldehyde dehydrogenase [Paracoccus denitrificans]WQO36964.1 aldehyde dehydrogenase [Paracoccus denitrificans]